MIFSVLLAPGNAARCKGNGKQGVAGVAALAPGAMDSRGGRNRGQNATPAVTATPRAASRHLCTMRWAAFFGHPDRGQGMERERGQPQRDCEQRESWQFLVGTTVHLLHECISCHHVVGQFSDPGNPDTSKHLHFPYDGESQRAKHRSVSLLPTVFVGTVAGLGLAQPPRLKG